MNLNGMKIDIDRMAKNCENAGIYAIESELPKRTVYMYSGDDVAIVRRNSFLRLKIDEMADFISELNEIYAELKNQQKSKRILKGVNHD